MQNENNSRLTNGRIGWDSDPRNPAKGSPVFETGGINHYPTSPLLNFSLPALPIPGATEIRFNGSNYSPAQDDARLTGQILRIFELMRDGGWRTLAEIEQETGDPQASISAQLRHLRKARFGSHTVMKRSRGERVVGLYEYRLIVRGEP